ncbi:glutamate--cysteine ligase regulatory subunit [Galleria mellonella]|uniref:GCS light chain n=1 Tax=Galleria mellonella TaxID=7137 RepID=A0A6J1WBY8_GALME|nr:glutamate--cysteine ligase regulatory subunit [Galleria mellonella]XP_026750499.2 glutamate--cysteine ligase regulatory subunit [Galleria mellonella]XP_026750500.2 glutamate--cysteine ligase regulatory subunit [Galleria mellonella]
MLKSASKVTINTGNVLNLIDIKKKAGQNVTEELSESIKLTLSEWSSQNGLPVQNGFASPAEQVQGSREQSNYMVVSTSTPREAVINITRPHDDVQNKMAEEERKNLKIGVKIFINEDSTSSLTECLENVFTALHTEYIDNVILAYNPDILHINEATDETNLKSTHATKASPISQGSNIARMPSTELEADSEADARKCEAILPGIKVLWAVLEDYVKQGRVHQLGVADVGGGCLRRLHAWAHVRPAIAQINLASCCVVPPALHEFCRANDVQLLTHGDPPDLLSLAAVKTLSDAGVGCNNLDWCARYQVHIKCRGVLALKGYVCKATLGNKDDAIE